MEHKHQELVSNTLIVLHIINIEELLPISFFFILLCEVPLFNLKLFFDQIRHVLCERHSVPRALTVLHFKHIKQKITSKAPANTTIHYY